MQAACFRGSCKKRTLMINSPFLDLLSWLCVFFCVLKFHPKDQCRRKRRRSRYRKVLVENSPKQDPSNSRYAWPVSVTGQVWFECLNLHEFSLSHRKFHFLKRLTNSRLFNCCYKVWSSNHCHRCQPLGCFRWVVATRSNLYKWYDFFVYFLVVLFLLGKGWNKNFIHPSKVRIKFLNTPSLKK